MSTVYTHTAVRQIGVAWRDEGCVVGGGGGEEGMVNLLICMDRELTV